MWLSLLGFLLLFADAIEQPGVVQDGEAKTSLSTELTSRYFSNSEMETYLRNFTDSSECGAISRMFSVGNSVEGFPLWVLELARAPGKPEAKPNFKYVANMHGDEPSGRQLLLKLAEWLCLNRESDPKAKAVIEGMHLYLMPSMNPDGYALERRTNKNGVDLNRDFPDRHFVPGPMLTLSGREQPETKAVAEWIAEGFFVGSGNLHEGALVANYPWDADETDKPHYVASSDDETFVFLAETYANAHLTMHDSTEFKGGITNGNAWYPVYGGAQDFNYLAGSCMSLTLELSDTKRPSPNLLELLWNQNKDAFIELALATTLRSFRGFVYGPKKTPLLARITVEGIDKDFFTRPKFGDFYRPLAPGTYDITISSEGYKSFKTEVVIRPGEEREMQRFALTPVELNRGLRTMNAAATSAAWETSYQRFLLVSAVIFTTGVVVARRYMRVALAPRRTLP